MTVSSVAQLSLAPPAAAGLHAISKAEADHPASGRKTLWLWPYDGGGPAPAEELRT